MILNTKINFTTRKNFSDKNLKFVTLFFYITLFLSLLIQVLLVKKNEEMYVVFFQFFANLIIFVYCLNKNKKDLFPKLIVITFFDLSINKMIKFKHLISVVSGFLIKDFEKINENIIMLFIR